MGNNWGKLKKGEAPVLFECLCPIFTDRPSDLCVSLCRCCGDRPVCRNGWESLLWDGGWKCEGQKCSSELKNPKETQHCPFLSLIPQVPVQSTHTPMRTHARSSLCCLLGEARVPAGKAVQPLQHSLLSHVGLSACYVKLYPQLHLFFIIFLCSSFYYCYRVGEWETVKSSWPPDKT